MSDDRHIFNKTINNFYIFDLDILELVETPAGGTSLLHSPEINCKCSKGEYYHC